MFPGKERDHIEKGGKLIMPPSALDQLSQLHISYPMLFKLTNGATDRITHCGVLEFVAEEGKIYMPYWMMQNLLLQEGDLVRVETAELPKATFSKFQPLSLAFLEITNPKAVLENALRNYACLTAGDVIAIHYNDIVYEISVLETKPGPAVSIIECDMNVDFAPPLGYTEDLKKKGEASKDNVAGPSGLPSRQMKTVDVPDDYDAPVAKRTVNAFAGQGQRLDGRTAGKKSTEPPAPTTTEPAPASGEPEDKPRIGIPDYDWKVGTLHFMPGVKLNYAGQSDEKGGSSFEAFTGAGNKLK